MTSKMMNLVDEVTLKKPIVQFWTCFEALSLDHNDNPVRRVLQVTAPQDVSFALDTFLWQKHLQQFHGQAFSSSQEYLSKVSKILPSQLKVSIIDSKDLLNTFEQEHDESSIFTTLRFLCPKSHQPFYGHMKVFGENMHIEKLRWGLLQIRSQTLPAYQVADLLIDIIQESNIDLSWALSRRGGISYQAATTDLRYQRSGIE